MKKIISLTLALVMVLAVGTSVYATDIPDWEQPGWTAIHEDGRPWVQLVDEYGNAHDLPSWGVAHALASPVLVNGVEFEFEAYTIGGYNHFRLRDLAYVLNGTEAQFDIAFNESTNTAYIFRGQPYAPIGGEMTGRASGRQAPLRSLTNFTVDGVEKSITAFNIEGNNFFRLRAVAFLLDFSVEWDGSRIVIDTSGSFEGTYTDPAEVGRDRGVQHNGAERGVPDITFPDAEEVRRITMERIRLLEENGHHARAQQLRDWLEQMD